MRTSDRRTSYVHRGVGLAVALAPFALLTASLLYGISGHDSRSVLGLVTELLALAFAGLNFFLSFGHGALHRWRNGSLDGYRHVSAIPVLGTGMAAIGGFVGFGSVLCAAIGLIAALIDTGGPIWFLVATWRDQSLWDE